MVDRSKRDAARRFYLANSILSFLVVTTIACLVDLKAGGPLLVTENGRPVTWAKGPVRGGRLGASTVDDQDRVIYRVDSGDLGPVGHELAVHLVDRIFGEYSSVETSTIRFENGGLILDPTTGQPLDVNATNVGKVLNYNTPTFQNPIIFDSDGAISGRGGVLGFYTYLNFSDTGVKEACVVLNGAAVNSVGGIIPFFGVFTHEFGHFAGPLDHSQVNGRIASRDSGVILPRRFTAGQLFDLFAPFIETLYPFLIDAPATGSNLRAQGLGNSGYFITSLDLDTKIALSNLYPAPGYATSEPGARSGSITGRVLVRANNLEVPISGLNVVARRISRGLFPPPQATQAFPAGEIPLDQDGVPLSPSERDETDPIATAASVVTGYVGKPGMYRIDGLPPGDYSIFVEAINPDAVRGSGIGPYNPQITLFNPEYYNGPRESNDSSIDDPAMFTPIPVRAGSTMEGIDIVLNDFGGEMTAVAEAEPNDALAQAQLTATQAQITGTISSDDAASIRIDLGSGHEPVPVQDLYRFRLNGGTDMVISLQALDPDADIDLFLCNGALKNGINPISGGPIIAFSASPRGEEFMIVSLVGAAADYYIGVSAYSGSTRYRLSLLDTEKYTPGTSRPSGARSPGWLIREPGMRRESWRSPETRGALKGSAAIRRSLFRDLGDERIPGGAPYATKGRLQRVCNREIGRKGHPVNVRIAQRIDADRVAVLGPASPQVR